jgi:hypothetical protein
MSDKIKRARFTIAPGWTGDEKRTRNPHASIRRNVTIADLAARIDEFWQSPGMALGTALQSGQTAGLEAQLRAIAMVPRVLTPAEAEELDRRDVEVLAVPEMEWLRSEGVAGFSLVIPPGPASGKVPYLRHDASGERLVDFPPTHDGRRITRNVHAVNVAAGHPERTAWLHCACCDLDHAADAAFVFGRPCPLCGHELHMVILEPKPPTLREWLGDRVSELWRWADVLCEQPPSTWHWRQDNSGAWILQAPGAVIPTTQRDVIGAVTWGRGPWADTCQMALFTRHPDVKPEPKRAEIICEDQYEVMP